MNADFNPLIEASAHWLYVDAWLRVTELALVTAALLGLIGVIAWALKILVRDISPRRPNPTTKDPNQ